MRQITSQDVDAVLDAIHSVRMIAQVISDTTDEFSRVGQDWQVTDRHSQRLCHFARQICLDSDRLNEVFNTAIAR